MINTFPFLFKSSHFRTIDPQIRPQMFAVTSFLAAGMLCMVTAFCWGSWSAVLKSVSKGTPYAVLYWDYTLGSLCLALVSALTIGNVNCPPIYGEGAFANIGNANFGAIMFGIMSGVEFNLANLLLVFAMEAGGISVAFPISVGMALVIGTVLNYVQVPLGDPVMLFSGVGLALLAILSNAMAHGSKAPAPSPPKLLTVSVAGDPEFESESGGGENVSVDESESVSENESGLASGRPSELTRNGNVDSVLERWKGKKLYPVGLAFVAGIAMSIWSPLITASMNHPGVPLNAFSASFLFLCGIGLATLPLTLSSMRFPLVGAPVDDPLTIYRKLPFKTHIVTMLAGVVSNTGTLSNLIAAPVAGYALSYAVGQSAPLIAAGWGIFVFKEFKGSGKKPFMWTGMMFVFYVGAITLLVLSRI